jgi:transposase
VPLESTEAERAELRRLPRRRGVGQALAQRVRIVLACAEPGATNLGVAGSLGVSRPTVATWRGRFAAHRLQGLTDSPRSGAPRTIGDEAVERLVALTLEEAPRDATHWSTRSTARQADREPTGEVRLDGGRETTSSSPAQPAEPAIYRAGGLRRRLRPRWIATQAPMGGPCPVPPGHPGNVGGRTAR